MRTRTALAGAALSGLAVISVAGVASAQESPAPQPGPITVTLSAEQAGWLCTKRLPRTEERVTKLLERVTGDASVRGSVEWLKARAQKERDAGRETSAQLLDERAERRAGKVDELNKIKTWVTEFRAKNCGGAK